YQFTLSYSRTTDAFGQVMIQDEATRKSVIRMENYDKEENFSLRMMLPVEITKWWNTSNMVHLYNNKYQSLIGTELLDVSQFSYMARTQHNITLPKGFKDRKSTRLNSSHVKISYAVFCLKKKKKKVTKTLHTLQQS